VAAADLEVVEVVVAEEDTVVDEEDLAVAAAVAGQEGDTEVAAAVVDMVTEGTGVVDAVTAEAEEDMEVVAVMEVTVVADMAATKNCY